MNDPHVKMLNYRIVPNENVDYKKAVPIVEDTEKFKMHLEGDSAVFHLKTHCSTVEEAKKLIGKYLRIWDILIGLEHNPEDLKFDFQSADIIDRSPSKDDKKTISLQNTFGMKCSIDGTLHLSHASYPSRPNKFAVSPDVETIYQRYKAYRQNKENLTSMAYMCLTVVEISAGGGEKRKEASKKYGINKKVLNELGKLCTSKGDVREARKASKNGMFVPLTAKEKAWIEAVVKALIRRLGEWAYDPNTNFKKLTMDDFPAL